jgi:hypothetical protein
MIKRQNGPLKLQNRFSGPFKIVNIVTPMTYKINHFNNKRKCKRISWFASKRLPKLIKKEKKERGAVCCE